jgi:hypothetical protein
MISKISIFLSTANSIDGSQDRPEKDIVIGTPLRGFFIKFGYFKLKNIYFLGGTIASLQALAIRIFTTVLAGILIGSPVAGFLPIRALRFTRTSLPIPGRVKAQTFLVSAIANAAISSMANREAFLERSNFFAKYETICDLVRGFFPAILFPPS